MDREKIGNVLQLMCWNLVSDSIGCSGKMCNKGEGSNRLCAGLEQHRDQILSKTDPKAIRRQERERIIRWLDENNVISIGKERPLNELGWLITMEKRQALRGDKEEK